FCASGGGTAVSAPDFCASGCGTTASAPDFCASGNSTTSSGQDTLGQLSSRCPCFCSCDCLSTALVARDNALSVDAVWLIRTNTMPHTTSSEMQLGTHQMSHLGPLACSRPVVPLLSERRIKSLAMLDIAPNMFACRG